MLKKKNKYAVEEINECLRNKIFRWFRFLVIAGDFIKLLNLFIYNINTNSLLPFFITISSTQVRNYL